MKPLLKDALLIATAALPNGAATTTTAGIQVTAGTTGANDFVADAEVLVEAPALATGLLPDAQTITYTVEGSNDNSAYVAVTGAAQFVQTGASGAGAAAGTLRYRPPSNAYKWYRAKAVKAGAADASTASVSCSIVF